LWSKNIFEPFQKEVRETFKRNAIELEEFKKRNNLK
jgi:hypothetical protein